MARRTHSRVRRSKVPTRRGRKPEHTQLLNQRDARTSTRRRPNSATTPFHDARPTNERRCRSDCYFQERTCKPHAACQPHEQSNLDLHEHDHNTLTTPASQQTLRPLSIDHTQTTEPRVPSGRRWASAREARDMGFQRLMNSNAATTETQGFGIRRLRSSPHKQRRRQQRQKLSKPGSMCDENHSPLGGADRTPRRMDCGRRIQALGRMAIWELEPATVEIKSFVP